MGASFECDVPGHAAPRRAGLMRFEELLQALADADAGGRILCVSPILEEDALLLQERYRSYFT